MTRARPTTAPEHFQVFFFMCRDEDGPQPSWTR